MDLTGVNPSNGHTHAASSSVEEIILEDPITLTEPAPNSSVEIIGERRPHGEPMAFIDLVDDSPNASRETSRGQVISVSSGPSQDYPPPDGDSPTPSDNDDINITRANVTLHTNLPMTRTPQHIFIKAEANHLSVKFLTFQADNIDDLVRAFFAEHCEGGDFDNPSELDNLAEFAFQSLLTPDDSQDSAQAVNISTSSNDFQTAKVTTVSKESPNVSRGTITVSDPDDSILTVDNSNPQTSSQSIRDMAVTRDLGFTRESGFQIEDVRTAGETTLDDAEDVPSQTFPTEGDPRDNGGAHAGNGNGEGDTNPDVQEEGAGGEPGAQGDGGDGGEGENVTRG